MKVGIIGPEDSTSVDILAELNGIMPTQIISFGRSWYGFRPAYQFAEKYNIPYQEAVRRSQNYNIRDFCDKQFIINNCDLLLLFCYNIECDIINAMWKLNKPCKVIKVYCNVTPKSSSYREIFIKETWHYRREYREKEYQETEISEKLYQFSELQDIGHDHIKLTINGGNDLEPSKLTLVGIDFKWIENVLISSYPKIYTNTRLNYDFVYKFGVIQETFFEFNGYTENHYEEDCITLKQQFDIIRNTVDLQQNSMFIERFGVVSKLKRFVK